MSVNIIKGSDKTIIVRLSSQETGDPFDLTNVSYIRASLSPASNAPANTDGNIIPLFEDYIAPFTGSITSGSQVISSIVDTTNLATGDNISGPGVPAGAVITGTPNDAAPTPSGQIMISLAASATTVGVALSAGNISILSPPVLGKIQVTLAADTTNFMESGPTENFEVKLVKGGITSIVQFPGALNVLERLI